MFSDEKSNQWYLAEIAQELSLEDEEGNTLYINYILISADSADNAYEKALRIGKEHEHTELMQGKLRRSVFRGLRDLRIVGEKIQSGTKIFVEVRSGITEEKIAELVRSQAEIFLFSDITSNEANLGHSESIVHIPHEATWYLAETVTEIREVEAAGKSVEIALVAIEAGSPQEGYKKGMEVGGILQASQAKESLRVFRGLHNLTVVPYGLEDAEEILYEEMNDVNETEILHLVKSKESLTVFKKTSA